MSMVHEDAGFRRFELSPAAIGLTLAMTGLAVWIGLSILAGLGAEDGFRLREAWDTQAYLYLGVPVMGLAVAAAAFLLPERVWRWPLCLVAGHQMGVLAGGLGMQSGLSLILLTLILAVLLAAFFTLPALVGRVVAKRLAERAY